MSCFGQKYCWMHGVVDSLQAEYGNCRRQMKPQTCYNAEYNHDEFIRADVTAIKSGVPAVYQPPTSSGLQQW